jgi:hypothetical protein
MIKKIEYMENDEEQFKTMKTLLNVMNVPHSVENNVIEVDTDDLDMLPLLKVELFKPELEEMGLGWD